MKPSIEPDEKVLLECPITLRLQYPLDMTPIKKTAYLTNNRLIIEKGEDFFYFPFDWMVGLGLSKSADSGDFIELGHDKKLRFSVFSTGTVEERNQKTEKLFGWIHHLCTRPLKSSEVLKEISASRKHFAAGKKR